eukprot:CAMPEP_0113491346 /NCGR_PEP_ID=MMETSP0014_2-20120614/27509_1 /TAXON_ID=2857 /ORGANISM="Nitzschia sp." /LENGTH=436 /DNA_ID=CAMNT_0000385135 /DNA_START=201 /DNA_END=1511 /DNA_ORIENTATION=- /assembly_acc=CAM_ASM_000159
MPPSGSLLFFLETPPSPSLAGAAFPVQPTTQQASADSDYSTTTTTTAAAATAYDHYQTNSHSNLHQGTQPPPPRQPIHLNLNMVAAEASTSTNDNNNGTTPTSFVLETQGPSLNETLQVQVSGPELLPDLMLDPTSSPQSSSPKRKSCMLRSSSISSVDSNSSTTSESSSSSDDSECSSYLNSYDISPTSTTTSSSKRTSRNRRVFFNTHEPADVCEIIHVSEYTDQERMSAWYNYYDLRSFKRERRESARRIEEQQRRRQKMSHHHLYNNNNHHHHVDEDGCDDSIRGVESLTESGSRLRATFIVNGINAVLNEQDLQDQDGTCSPDMLAHVYSLKCDPSRRVAHERALADQQEARRLYREDEEEGKRTIQQINMDGVTNQEYEENLVVMKNDETSMEISSSSPPPLSSQHDEDETMKTIDLFSSQENNNFQLTD